MVTEPQTPGSFDLEGDITTDPRWIALREQAADDFKTLSNFAYRCSWKHNPGDVIASDEEYTAAEQRNQTWKDFQVIKQIQQYRNWVNQLVHLLKNQIVEQSAAFLMKAAHEQDPVTALSFLSDLNVVMGPNQEVRTIANRHHFEDAPLTLFTVKVALLNLLLQDLFLDRMPKDKPISNLTEVAVTFDLPNELTTLRTKLADGTNLVQAVWGTLPTLAGLPTEAEALLQTLREKYEDTNTIEPATDAHVDG